MPSEQADPVASILEAGRAAFPAASVDRAAIAAFVRARDLEGKPIDAPRAADLYLACACASGDARAIAAFEGKHLSQLASFLASREKSAAVVDEVLQLVRERLFVGTPETPPKIAEYGGTGALHGWLRVVALRVHANLRRQDRFHDDIDEAPEAAQMTPLDPEMTLLRERYKSAFDEALRAAFAALPDRERAVLRLQFKKQLTLDQIAMVLQVHRATVARSTAAARERLLRGITVQLRERMRVSDRELQSLMGAFRSQLDVSLSGLFCDTAA